MFGLKFSELNGACELAEAIVATVREPVLVLDHDLRVIHANRSFLRAFKATPEATEGALLHELGDGQWDIPELLTLLGNIVSEDGTMDDFEVEREFPQLGRRTMCLNARRVFHKGGEGTNILLAIEDITEKHRLRLENEELMRQKDVLLEEIQHRIGNSLQIIASIILMKARSVHSEETRTHLQDAHNRVMSVAALQKQLHVSRSGGIVEVAPYLTSLCESLTASMIDDDRSVSVTVAGGGGRASSSEAESLGLIVTELVMNALKHAFPVNKPDNRITVAYDAEGTNWKLSVTDNGIGRPDGVFAQAKTGLGTGIVKALAQQLDAQIETVADPDGGTVVSITHATFEVKSPGIASADGDTRLTA